MAIRASGVEHVYLETRNWGATVAFWKRFGFEVEFETDHHSGSLAHPRGGPRLFVSERHGEAITQHLCLGIDDADEASLEGFDVAKPWTAEHWDVMEAIVRDPDGRSVSLQAPLPEHVVVDHHDHYWLGARPTLAVDDVGATLAVFVDTLGWNVFTTMGDPVDFAMIGAARATLALARSDAPPVTDIASVYVDVLGVAGVHAKCVEHGLEISHPLTDHPWGQRDFCVRLPSGHQIAFGERTG
jgi:uncharacterized glyoxalase superfamily protein PhnB